jgi:hypothetical protein
MIATLVTKPRPLGVSRATSLFESSGTPHEGPIGSHPTTRSVARKRQAISLSQQGLMAWNLVYIVRLQFFKSNKLSYGSTKTQNKFLMDKIQNFKIHWEPCPPASRPRTSTADRNSSTKSITYSERWIITRKSLRAHVSTLYKKFLHP